jgi:TAT (twin-arginine translocation) pathway signal sequence
MLSRRELIKTGVAGAAVLALANCARSNNPAHSPFEDPSYPYKVLTPGDRATVAAIGSALLLGALPADPAAHATALIEVVRGVDIAAAGLTPAPQGELQQLFGLLSFPLTRGFATGIWSSWDDAAPADVAKFLESWRFSGVMLFKTAYQALHTIVMASWYGNNASWATIGYPGPPRIA